MNEDNQNGGFHNWHRLEQSWRALQAFQTSHTGRIGTDVQLERRLSLDQGIIDVNGFLDNDESDISSGDETIDFIIPELPHGQVLHLRVMSTWGDPYYVGLNGLEIFSDQGCKVIPSTIECSGPNDAIPDCSKVDNLIDGNYRTRDDTRLWLATFNHSNPPTVTLTFHNVVTIAMIRIWNYNQSRIHSNRGVKLMEMKLDQQLIFRGEISKAAGSYLETDIFGDTVLFTTDDNILEKISENDQFLDDEREDEDRDDSDNTNHTNSSVRPSTGERPTSRKLVRQISTSDDKAHDALRQMYSVEGSAIIVKGSTLTLQLVSNWGYDGNIGLTGLQLLDRKGKAVTISRDMITCSQGANIDRLLNRKCLTTDVNQMFFTSFTPPNPINININVCGFSGLQGMTIWNYNGPEDKSYAGVRSMNILVDDEFVLSDVMIRKAPGNMNYDFAQDISFGEHQLGLRDWALNAITGFVLQIQLLSTWGDEFYAGLNGIEILDIQGHPEKISMKNLAAYPESVNVLPSVKDDPRSSDKLIDYVNDTTDPQHMWLAPLIPNQINRVYLIFDWMKTMHGLRMFNYRKTPQRGVRDIIVLLDDLIVYSGQIPISTDTDTGILTVDFTNPTVPASP